MLTAVVRFLYGVLIPVVGMAVVCLFVLPANAAEKQYRFQLTLAAHSRIARPK